MLRPPDSLLSPQAVSGWGAVPPGGAARGGAGRRGAVRGGGLSLNSPTQRRGNKTKAGSLTAAHIHRAEELTDPLLS